MGKPSNHPVVPNTPTLPYSITPFLLIRRSLRFYWRTHLGVVAGVALAGAILTGALTVGDSVRESLRQLALTRLGRITLALNSGDRFFRAALGNEIGAAPAVLARGAVATPDGHARANDAQIVGVDGRFWKLGGGTVPSGIAFDSAGEGTGSRSAPGGEEIAINQRLAAQLGARVGDTLVLRMEPPSWVPRDAALSGRSDAAVAFRARVAAVAGDAEFGRFSLQANQVAPYTVFVPLARLQQELKRPGQANVLLADHRPAALRRHWTLADVELELKALPDWIQLETPRVFLEPIVAAAALDLPWNPVGVLTWFVNEIRCGDLTTPYSFVTAVGTDLADDEIRINSWLAEDLGAKVGDKVVLRYFVMGEGQELVERSARFRVRAIMTTERDDSWMPPYPGLADAGNCRDWAPGIPIALDRIRPKDEAYWEKYRGTPKAFVSLAAGQRLWANRFGKLTAVRFAKGGQRKGRAAERGMETMPLTASPRQEPRRVEPTPAPSQEGKQGSGLPSSGGDGGGFRSAISRLQASGLEQTLCSMLDPASLGLFFVPVREQALRASAQSTDFGQLFLGFSLFLIVAALLLTAMLVVFNVEQRHAEVGLLRAIGWGPRQVRRLLMGEGLALVTVGTLIGVAAGTVYTKLALAGLATVWQRAVGSTALGYHAAPATLLAGAASAWLAAAAALWLAQRRQTRRGPAELLSSGAEVEMGAPGDTAARRRSPDRAVGADRQVCVRPRRGETFGPQMCGVGRPSHSGGAWLGFICLLGAGVVAGAGGGKNPEAFFSAGALLLIAGIAFSRQLLVHLTRPTATARKLATVGRRNAARRRGRSLTTISVLASGVFLLVAVNAFHQDARPGAPGTGGFALYAQSALPIYDDLNTATGRDRFGLTPEEMRGGTVVPLCVHEGDDASCLNLNRAQQPRLLGVRPSRLAVNQRFTLSKNWLALDQRTLRDPVPAIGDEATVTWALGKKRGDTLTYTDGRGRSIPVRIVDLMPASILQGSLVISEANFVRLFPEASGYRVFLIDAPAERADAVAAALSRALEDRGLEVVPAWRRLAEFLEVENTYLGIFQALGGLGLLLGSVGLGIVVLRNVLERRGELALMQAVGFRRRALVKLVLSEHGLLVGLGLAVGLVAAVLAVWPALGAGTELPVRLLAATLIGLTAGGWFWNWLAARVALRGPLLDALREE